MFNVYNQHKGSNIKSLPHSDLEGVEALAHSYARLGYDALLRVFEVTDTGERFVTAFSVLNGCVVEHANVTIPTEHW